MYSESDRRSFGRRAASIRAWLVVPGRAQLSCRLVNITPTGALLEMTPPAWLPFRFKLRVEGHDALIECEIRHTRSYGVGVTFCREEPAVPDRTASRMDFDDLIQWTGEKRNLSGKSGR